MLLLFVIAKWPHLSYPFYWDESWSYAPGVRLMYDHGPSLMPNAIDTFYSRGHPLFFYAAASAWMHLTGGYSHFNAHLFALAITVCLLVTVYAVTLRIAGRFTALVAVAALMLHVGFFVQATSVMPEMLVALFSLLALSAFAFRKFGLAGIALTFLLLTKESGIVAAFVLGMATLIMLFRREITSREKVYALLSVAIPGILTGAFFGLQKHLLGWYFYPEHTGLISLDWGTFFGKFQVSLGYLLSIDGPRWLVKSIFLALGAVALRYRTAKPLLPLLPLSVAYLIARHKIDFLPSKLQFFLVVFVLTATLICCLRKYAVRTDKKRWVLLLTAFSFLYLCFCGLNFFTLRYLLAVIVPVTIGLCALLVWALKQLSPKAVWLAPLVVATSGFFMFRSDKGLGDMNLQSYSAMRVQEATVRFLENKKWFGRPIGTGSFQDAEHLRRPYTGFLHTPRFFQEVRWDMDSLTEVAVFNNIEPDARLVEIKKDSSYQLVYRIQKGEAWAEVYARKGGI